ncbi:MAG: hypothetical protein IH899_02485 [Planctomycetes bacterium]|nr:hypothetical protein [Planctomycetota bacterium]
MTVWRPVLGIRIRSDVMRLKIDGFKEPDRISMGDWSYLCLALLRASAFAASIISAPTATTTTTTGVVVNDGPATLGV